MNILQAMLLGVCFNLIAVSMIGDNVRLLVGRRFKRLLRRHASRPAMGGLWGMMLAMVTGKPGIVSHIMASLLTLGAVGLPVALATVLWAEVGGLSIYFLFALDVTAWILVVAAVAGILYAIGRPRGPRPLFGVIFGIGFLLYSVGLLKGAASELSQLEWFPALLANGDESLLVTLFTSVALTVVSQSPIGINMVTLALLKGGALSLLHAVLISCGIAIGLAISRLKYWASFRGRSRSLLVLPILLKVATAGMFVTLLLAGPGCSRALVLSLLESAADAPTTQYLLFILIFSLTTAIVGGLLSRPFVARVAPLLERTADDEMFVPRFTNQFRDDEPEAAVELLERETGQLLAGMPVFLQMTRRTGRPQALAELDALHASYLETHEAIQEFGNEAFGLGIEASRRFVRAIEMQHLLGQLEESIVGMARVSLATESGSPTFDTFRDTLIESIDFMLGTTIDCFEGSDDQDRAIFEAVTRDKGPLIAEMREAYLGDAEHLSQAEQAALLALLIHFDALVNQMRQLGLRREATLASDTD